LENRKSWKSVDFKKPAGSEKDVETSMKNLTTNIGERTQEETEEAKRKDKTKLRAKSKMKYTYSSHLLVKLTCQKKKYVKRKKGEIIIFRLMKFYEFYENLNFKIYTYVLTCNLNK